MENPISFGEFSLSDIAPNQVLAVIHGGAAAVDHQPERSAAARSAFRKIETTLSRDILENARNLRFPIIPQSMAEKFSLAAIRELEEEPTLNAGRGAALQRDGVARVSASFMESTRERFSAVVNLERVVCPSELAFYLQSQPYSVLDAQGAENLARQLEVPREELLTEARLADWRAANIGTSGTVGCVVVDSEGKLAASTSTGGLGNEIVGRIGDTPTVAGNFCNPRVAVSCTGVGEQITSLAFSARTSVRVLDGMPLRDALGIGIAEAKVKKFHFGAIAVSFDPTQPKGGVGGGHDDAAIFMVGLYAEGMGAYKTMMKNTLEKPEIKVLFSQADIARRVAELGKRISEDYAGKTVVVVGVLKGSFIFLADLVRQIRVPVNCEFISVSSYGNEKKSSGEVKLILDIAEPLEGKHIIIVEDIIDSGLTLKFLIELLSVRNPASVRACALLEKPKARKTDVKIDYVGFQINDEFVIGYGLDFAQNYRELPYIGYIP